jgi:hypothetical protein
MWAYDVIINKGLLLKYGYLFWRDGREAAKIVDITIFQISPTVHVKVTAEIKKGETITMERSWTENFKEVVIS